MKLRIVFLKKKYIVYILIILALTISLFAILKFKNKSVDTINTIKKDKSIKADFNGDGEEDTLYVKTEKDKYYIQVNTKHENIFLEPNKKLNTIGNYYSYWPMKINLLDITRDKRPEIFIQSSQNNLPIQHVFIWDVGEFKDVFCSSNNIIGFLDIKSNKTPKFISGNLKEGKMDLSYNILLGKNFKNYSYNSSTLPGKDIILNFVQYIESLPEGEGTKPDVFYDGLSGKDIAVIGQLAAEDRFLTFLDGSFFDSKSDKDGNITEIKWNLNFKGSSKTLEEDKKYYPLKITLKPCNSFNNEFRIASLSLSSE